MADALAIPEIQAEIQAGAASIQVQVLTVRPTVPRVVLAVTTVPQSLAVLLVLRCPVLKVPQVLRVLQLPQVQVRTRPALTISCHPWLKGFIR